MENLQPLQQVLSQRRPTMLGVSAAFSVLCPLVWQEREWHLLFEVRSATLRRQPGEICFPGGRMEPGETPIQTALRETQEELALPASAINILGEGDFLASGSGFMMHSVLGEVTDLSTLTPSPAEVDHVFTVPVSFFRNNPPQWGTYDLVPTPRADYPFEAIGFPQGYTFRGGAVSSPIWTYGDHIIWGMTARVVAHVVELLDFSQHPSC